MVEQRLEFCRLAEGGGVPFAVLCRRFGIKRDTGYKWLARYRREGEAGLVDRSRAPKVSPRRTPGEIEELVVSVREAHPVWGGRKIRGFLLRQGHLGVPAASTITRILRSRGLLSQKTRQGPFISFEHPAPNDLWQMDFKGWFWLRDRRHQVHTLGVLDDHSRYNLCLAACSNERTETVKGLLTGAFGNYGLPYRMLMDNGSPWGNDAGQPWTPLTVWLVDLGITIVHSRPFHPQTAGKEERFHLTLDLEVISQRPDWDTYQQVQDAYDDWRPLYNHHRPHDSLGETVVPADRYRPSPRDLPTRIEEPAYPDGTHHRRVDTINGTISWRGHTHRVGRAFRGRTVGIRSTPQEGTYHVYYRHHHIRTITTP